ncbi:pirin family protein [Methylomonas sp. MgM2]
MTKTILGIYNAPDGHWVGDGFPVRSLFSYQSHGKQLSPFLLLDYAGPRDFAPSAEPRGVGPHPHRGFETVTIVYKGEVAHRDSTGKGGVIGPGDVQWMTAGAGILHEELHSKKFSESGGTLEMVQLWVNLPAKDKMTPPGYQAISDRAIPNVALAGHAGTLRVIAGEYQGRAGPAKTFTPMHVWDLQLNQDGISEFALPEGWSVALAVLHGSVRINGTALARDAELAVLDRNGKTLSIEAETAAKVLLLSGEPIAEPIVGHGPFVMNSRQEIDQAVLDFNGGGFGRM